MKLELSLEKTVVMKLKEMKINKGKAQKRSDRKRKLGVRVRGRRIEAVTEVRHLGSVDRRRLEVREARG